MATSISKSQAQALASGFDFGGSSREELQPRETLSVLYQLAGGLVEAAQRNLNSSDRVSSGKGASSIKVLNPEIVGRSIRIDIEMLYYLQFIDAGVKGTRGGSSSQGYSFRDKQPPMNVIRKWILREGLKHRVDKHDITKREKRRRVFHKTITGTEQSVKSLAFIIARAIKIKGLKRTNFMFKAIQSARRDAKAQLAAGLKVDVINAIPKKL